MGKTTWDRGLARFSDCLKYRYLLTRRWEEGPLVAFILLNPSTADEHTDDPTIRRCIGFARRWGFGGLIILNLFAYRSTNPKKLYEVRHPVGEDNDRTILRAVKKADQIIAAWGTHGAYGIRDQQVLRLLKDYEIHCLGKTKDGHPKHPLYLKNSTRRQVFLRNNGE